MIAEAFGSRCLRRSGAKLVRSARRIAPTSRTTQRDHTKTAAIFASTRALKVIGSSRVLRTARARGRRARARRAFIHDLGSGTFPTPRVTGWHASNRRGSRGRRRDLVTFAETSCSGSAGGMGSGMRTRRILRAPPLMRALRPDKRTPPRDRDALALPGRPCESELPCGADRHPAGQRSRSARRRSIAARAAGIDAAVVSTDSTVGGGSLPEETQPSRASRSGRAATIVAKLRAARPAVSAASWMGGRNRSARDLPEDDEILASTSCGAQ